MFIQTETTPNPLTLKFLPGRAVAAEGVWEFRDADEAAKSPLARALFEVEGVSRVFFGPDFLTVTRAAGSHEWPQLKAPLLAAIMEHYTSGAPLLLDAAATASAEHTVSDDYDADTLQVISEIKDLLDTRIRPAVSQDGGDILFDKFEPATGVVWLTMRGACSGCPSSTATLKSGVENLLKHYVPEVTRVEQTV
jgi:Fe-S cluster biogenesis protein NfuA